jgi:hypothetical protein
MSAKTQINKIKTLLNMTVKLEQMKLENGTVLEADAFEAGAECFIVNEEDRIPIPMGEYELEDGKILVIAEDGIIGEVKEAAQPEEEAPAVEEAEPQAEEVAAEAETASPKKVVESITKEMFFSEIEKLRAEIAELKSQKEEVVEEKAETELAAESQDENTEVELSKEEDLKHSPEAKVDKTPMFKFASKAPESTKDRIFNKLFNN